MARTLTRHTHTYRDRGEPLAHCHPDSTTPKFADHDEHVQTIARVNGGCGFPFVQATEISPDPRPPGGLKSLLAEVCERRGVSADEVYAGSRLRPVAHAKQEFMWLARQVRWPDGRHRYSLPMIARFLNLQDHTTVLHGERAHQARLDEAASTHAVAA